MSSFQSCSTLFIVLFSIMEMHVSERVFNVPNIEEDATAETRERRQPSSFNYQLDLQIKPPPPGSWYDNCGIRYQDAPAIMRRLATDSFLDGLNNETQSYRIDPCTYYKTLLQGVNKLLDMEMQSLGGICQYVRGYEDWMALETLFQVFVHPAAGPHQIPGLDNTLFKELLEEVDRMGAVGDGFYCAIDKNVECSRSNKTEKNGVCLCRKRTQRINDFECGLEVNERCMEVGGSGGVFTRKPCAAGAFCYFDEFIEDPKSMICRCPNGFGGPNCKEVGIRKQYSEDVVNSINDRIRNRVKSLTAEGGFKDFDRKCDPEVEINMFKKYKDVDALLRSGEDLLQIAEGIDSLHWEPLVCDFTRFLTCSPSRNRCDCKEGLSFDELLNRCVISGGQSCKVGNSYTAVEFGFNGTLPSCTENCSDEGVCQLPSSTLRPDYKKLRSMSESSCRIQHNIIHTVCTMLCASFLMSRINN